MVQSFNTGLTPEINTAPDLLSSSLKGRAVKVLTGLLIFAVISAIAYTIFQQLSTRTHRELPNNKEEELDTDKRRKEEDPVDTPSDTTTTPSIKEKKSEDEERDTTGDGASTSPKEKNEDNKDPVDTSSNTTTTPSTEEKKSEDEKTGDGTSTSTIINISVDEMEVTPAKKPDKPKTFTYSSFHSTSPPPTIVRVDPEKKLSSEAVPGKKVSKKKKPKHKKPPTRKLTTRPGRARRRYTQVDIVKNVSSLANSCSRLYSSFGTDDGYNEESLTESLTTIQRSTQRFNNFLQALPPGWEAQYPELLKQLYDLRNLICVKMGYKGSMNITNPFQRIIDFNVSEYNSKERIQAARDLIKESRFLLNMLPEKLPAYPKKVPQSNSWIGKFWELVETISEAFVAGASLFADLDYPWSCAWKVLKYEKRILQIQRFVRSKALQKSNSKPNIKKEVKMTDSISFEDMGSTATSQADFLEFILSGIEIQNENPNRFNLKYLEELRKYNSKFIPPLRAEMSSLQQRIKKSTDSDSSEGFEELEQELALLDEISDFLFTGIVIEDVCQYTVNLFRGVGSRYVQGGNLSGEAKEIYGHLKNPFTKDFLLSCFQIKSVDQVLKGAKVSQQGNSLEGHFNTNFKPHTQGNPTHVLYSIKVQNGKKEPKTVQSLGFGTPTEEENALSASIIPELRSMLRSYLRKGKKHLFILNQNTKPKTTGTGNETNRTDEILDLQEDEGAENYYAIALSKNSTFYKTGGEEKNAEEFKKNLLNQFIPEESTGDARKALRMKTGCYISQKIIDELKEKVIDFDAKSTEMLNIIHEEMFGRHDELTPDERKLMIEHFYDSLSLFLIKELDVDSFNISCKDAIDRGAGSNAQLYANLAIVNCKKEKFNFSAADQARILMIMYARALFARKRQAYAERVIPVAKMIDDNIAKREAYGRMHKRIFGKATRFIQQRPVAASAA